MKSTNVLAPSFPKRKVRTAEELAFLPAALEIVETPVPPLAGIIGGTIVALFCLALVWASFGKIDIVATATGRIQPSGRTKIIQPFENGVVRAIHVDDGQVVRAGDLLIEIDSTINAAERDRNAKELLAQQLDVARLRAALAVAGDQPATFVPPEGASGAQIDLQKALLINQLDEYRAKLGNLDRQIAQNEANRKSVVETIQKLKLTIPLLQQRVDARRKLAQKGFAVVLVFLQDQQDLIEHQQELLVQEAKLEQAEAQTAALQEQRRQASAEFGRTNRSDLAQAEQKAGSLQEQVTEAEQRRQLQTLTAPIDGTVQQLAVHTIGGVVTAAQQLMVVVPSDSHLEAEAMVSNRDIGFVHPGQEAEIKIDTFNFTRYGLLHGTVQSVSQDAIVRDKPADKSGSEPTTFGGALSDSSEPKGQELLYAARVSLDKTKMQVEDRLVNLGPGMAVTVEIKTGSRSIISYLLSPLLRYGHESLRER
jgi:hemolysin D